MITINGLSKSYGKKRVLENLSAQFSEGMIHGILGPNGCGKTTLIKSMLGLINIQAGEVLLNGVALQNSRDKVAWLPQHPEAPLNTTPRELLNFIEKLRGTPALFKDEVIREFNFFEELDSPLKSLSGGNYQKCFLVMTLMFDVPLIILDEPTVGLDPVSVAKFKHFLKRRSKTTTILLISHITSEIEQLADRVHFLLDGKWVFNGSVQELNAKTGKSSFESSLVDILSSSSAGEE